MHIYVSKLSRNWFRWWLVAKPSSEPMLAYYELDPYEQNFNEIWNKIHQFSYKKMNLFVSKSMFQTSVNFAGLLWPCQTITCFFATGLTIKSVLLYLSNWTYPQMYTEWSLSVICCNVLRFSPAKIYDNKSKTQQNDTVFCMVCMGCTLWATERERSSHRLLCR